MFTPSLFSTLTTTLFASLFLIPQTYAKPVTTSTTSIVNLYLPQLEVDQHEPIVGSVVSAGASLTTYSVHCPRGTPLTACGVGSGIGVVVGPKTVIWHMSFGPKLAAEVTCALNPSRNDATCTGDYIAKGKTSHATDTFTRFSTFAVPVTLTAGIEKLPPSTSAVVTTSHAPKTTAATPRVLVAATSTTTTSTGTAAATASTLTPTSSAPSISSSISSVNYASHVTLHFSDSTVPTVPTAAAAVTANTSSGGVSRVSSNALLVGIAALAGGAAMII
ncbi:hypothetical protein B0T19DRAFT_234875 [Cercophora scortea]|uniref:GPI anchored protein n=1 Tax=Cercophora scortea TaxID=314031 RepID=A0AAE0IGU3_9PEZI|nr:hypothetical protein B0T19DRAFT_234875 [Cercophora scortea]